MSSHEITSHSKQSGFSIVELLVAMIIISILSGIVYIFFSSSINDFIKIQTTNNVTTDRTRAMNRMIQVIRGVNRIEVAADNNLTVYTFFSPTDNIPSKVTYNYKPELKKIEVTHVLAEGVAPNYTYDTADAKTHTILSEIELSKPLFNYVDKLGGTGPFDDTNYNNITQIGISLSGKTVGNIMPIDMETSILLRNRTGVQ